MVWVAHKDVLSSRPLEWVSHSDPPSLASLCHFVFSEIPFYVEGRHPQSLMGKNFHAYLLELRNSSTPFRGIRKTLIDTLLDGYDTARYGTGVSVSPDLLFGLCKGGGFPQSQVFHLAALHTFPLCSACCCEQDQGQCTPSVQGL